MAGELNYSGMPDYLVTKGKTALVVDYKTGTGKVTGSRENLQLLALAVLVKANHPKITKVYAAIIQPMHPVEWAEYDSKALKDGRQFIEGILRVAMSNYAHREAGEKQCRFCKAKADCPEAIAATLTVSKGAQALSDPERFAQLLDYVGVAKKMIPEIEERARVMLEENPDAIDGYVLKDGVQRREIASIEAAFQALKQDGLIDQSEFIGACKASITGLEKAVKESSGLSGKEAKEAVSRSLGDLVSSTKGKPRLVKQ